MGFVVYYINLARSVARNEFMLSQFNSFGVGANKITAVDGAEFSKEALADAKQHSSCLAHFAAPLAGEIAAFLSHKKSWQLIASQDADFGIVFEDDVSIDRQLFVDLDAIIKQITPNDIVDISGRQGIWQKQKTTVKADLNMNLSVVPALGMTGKIIGKYAAKQLLNAMPIYLAPVDVMMQKSYQHRVKIWSVNKKYLLHKDQIVGGTTIQIKSVSWYQKLGREVKRPIWRLAVIIKSFVFD